MDRGLFDELRGLRKKIAAERDVPPYVIFSDATLRELARVRPSTLVKMKLIYGIGDRKLSDLGDMFLQAIDAYCEGPRLARDVASLPPASATRPAPSSSARDNPTRDAAFRLFADGAVVEDVMHQVQRSRSTAVDYLAEYLRERRPESTEPWVSKELYQRIAKAAQEIGTARLKPIFVALDEQVSYDEIRLVVAHLQGLSG